MDSISFETNSILENELSDIQTGSLTLENADMFNKVAGDLELQVADLFDVLNPNEKNLLNRTRCHPLRTAVSSGSTCVH